ncbi:Microtubule-binding protein TANGLED [Sesamum alatum]|uniref:Microtubule-binding protein TANGLED n=1 Tax=Sesamum alatum TaxID=300844 RepID=A0AAE1Y6K6_9LAMI|nr:Microtubule-binding protein TANGLED [Sesamum alatum]
MGKFYKQVNLQETIVDAVASKPRKPATDDPKTPLAENRKQRSPSLENSGLQARRRREKQVVLQTIRSEAGVPSLQRAKSRINFKGSSPVQNGVRECDKENCRYIANRVSPRNRPWARKTVLFPNPLFHSSPTKKSSKLLQD